MIYKENCVVCGDELSQAPDDEIHSNLIFRKYECSKCDYHYAESYDHDKLEFCYCSLTRDGTTLNSFPITNKSSLHNTKDVKFPARARTSGLEVYIKPEKMPDFFEKMILLK